MYKINCRCSRPMQMQNCDCNMEDNMLDETCKNVISEPNNNQDKCACGFEEECNAFPSNPMLGHAYVPRQKMDRVFTPCVGLQMGTMFPELVSPYVPCQSIEENEFLRIREMEVCGNGRY